MTFSDAAGLVGVVMMLIAYAGAQAGRLDPVKAPALATNLVGASLVMLSLLSKFNVSAFLMEAAWAAIAGWGLVRIAISRR